MKIDAETFKTWDKLADLYWVKFSAVRIYDHTYDAFLEQLRKNDADIMDLGCGPGIISHYLFSHNNKIKITGVDVSPNMIKKANDMIPGFTGHVMQIQEFAQLKGLFDGILCGFGFPYLDEPEVRTCLETCHSKLKEDGLLYVSFVEGSSSVPDIKQDPNGNRIHFFYHESTTILKYLEELGFTVVHQWNIPYPGSDGESQEHVIFLVRKGRYDQPDKIAG